MMSKCWDAVIIGGGVHGCSLAYHLVSQGLRPLVLERSYLASGGTGRSAAGVRHQFGTEVNCLLAIENIRAFERIEEELDYPWDLEFQQGGYLLIAYSEGQLGQFQENVALQQRLGIDSVMLSPEETLRLVPELNPEGVLGASYCARDGHINPFHLTWAYARAAQRLGATIRQYCPVISITGDDSGVRGVVTPDGTIECPNVVVAAGPWGPSLVEPLGLEVPLYSERHQIMVTEPVERFLDPMILCFDDGTYWKQTPHGSVIMGIGDPMELKGLFMSSSWSFLEEAALRISSHMPSTLGLRVVRQWAGLYDITPDSQAIIGPTPVEGLYLDLGWSGHGLQFAPSVGRILAQLISGQEPFIPVDALGLDRFQTGRLIPEPACV